jgi:hypothetical protein
MKVISTPNDKNGVPETAEKPAEKHVENVAFAAPEKIDFSKVVTEIRKSTPKVHHFCRDHRKIRKIAHFSEFRY